ncbi:beta-galactosidase [Paraburkholderia strydomiana]|uniref:beta-galactosidase n=1 Tax=Paraburkholderia strydomiana TaxID=1245417 RepID=UPI001BEC9843|nr:beta-galactosidase [Paraburkholderia strydomiana]MBT2794319.1 beta-galactosidase [Paraburkholderia strydomiana]
MTSLTGHADADANTGSTAGGHATLTLSIDASAPATAPLHDTLRVGTSTSPDGSTIGINSRYLTRDGEPWLPVMGEIHYARMPASQWDDTLLKVKAAGVDIVASYVVWRHHEPRAGTFDWSERLDLRRFVETCAKRDLLALIRVGPWVHAEVRYGGLPGWVVDQMPTRGDNPLYLHYVARLFSQIAAQLHGLLWKDGGPVIGIQLENEYNLSGPQQGAAHIATLKRLARDAGLDVPLYTVTGWDNAVFPRGEVGPVFGGYPDLPWGVSPHMSPPNEVYGFRFASRVGGDLGAQTHSDAPGDADAVAHETPFLGAEFGGGVPAMYRRRPVLDADDIAAMLPVQLGSGVNLYGYYMLHGGRNPPGDMDGQESTASGGYNDVPIVNYDFQSPFGANGEAREVLGKLRPIHYFLRQWGAVLAPCDVYAPDTVSHGPADLATPRFAVRANGDQGFLFFNNHVREHAMPAHRGMRFSVKLAGGSVALPAEPVDIAPGTSFIWPIGLRFSSVRLRYATAQPVTQISGDDGDVYVFAATDGIAPQFAFDSRSVATIAALERSITPAHGGEPALSQHEDDGVLVVRPRNGAAFVVTDRGGARLVFVTLLRKDAERLSVLPFDGRRRLILSDAFAFERDGHLVLRSNSASAFDVDVYPPLLQLPSALQADHANIDASSHGMFQRLRVHAPRSAFDVRVTPLRAPQAVPPVMRGGTANAAVAPLPETFGKTAAWRIDVTHDALHALDAHGLGNAYLTIRYRGDVARIFSGTELIDDHFYNGLPWRIGVRNVAIDPDAPLMLTILPLRADAPVYLAARHDPRPGSGEQIAELDSVTWEPEYEVILAPNSPSHDVG